MPTGASPDAPAAARRIDVEAHFYPQSYLKYLRSRTDAPREQVVDGEIRVWRESGRPDRWHPRPRALGAALEDMADGRIAVMDEAGVSMQVVSLAGPGCEQFDPVEGTAVARAANDELAELIAAHPERLAGLAALAPLDPDAAADELERCVTKLGFRGAKINSHVGDTYLDDQRYLPLWERAAALGVPINLHPIPPHASMAGPYTGYGFVLLGPGLGYGAETAVHTMRLVYSGLFDRFPDLQIQLGHLGEGLYFWLYRLDFDSHGSGIGTGTPKLERRPSDYLKQNVHVSTSANFLTSAFLATFMEIGSERLMLGSDHPFESAVRATRFVESVPISDDDREKLRWRNAARLFRLDDAPVPA